MSGEQRGTSAKKNKHKLEVSILECLSTLRSIKFGFLKFGSLCNAAESNAFTSARCDIDNIKNDEDEPYTIDFETLFKLGLDLLETLRPTKKHPTLSEGDTAALEKLIIFFEKKDGNEKSLTKILFDEDKKYSEADFTVTLAEHLFKLLAPEPHYVIDKGSRGKSLCKCNRDICEEKQKYFEKTGIGHENVWHGFIDLVLVSNECDTEDLGRWRNIIEVKRSLSRSKFAVMDQAIAQTIVFSFLQKGGSRKIFIPNILISPKEFRVIMYNTENDLLICSEPLNLFTEQESKHCLNFSSLIVLWMVLHYEMFLEDVKQVVQKDCIQHVKAEFNAEANHNVYWTSIQSSVKHFHTHTNKGYFPDSESLAKGKNVSRKNVSVNELAGSVSGINLVDEESKTESKSGKTKKEN